MKISKPIVTLVFNIDMELANEFKKFCMNNNLTQKEILTEFLKLLLDKQLENKDKTTSHKIRELIGRLLN